MRHRMRKLKMKINVSICKTKRYCQRATLNCHEWKKNWGQVIVKHGSPVAPKVLPVANSHMPAKNWASPPQKMAIPTTTFGAVMPRVWRLYNDKIKVVEAKENKPLSWLLSWTKTNDFSKILTVGQGCLICVKKRALNRACPYPVR